jgi:hypothetical protein
VGLPAGQPVEPHEHERIDRIRVRDQEEANPEQDRTDQSLSSGTPSTSTGRRCR